VNDRWYELKVGRFDNVHVRFVVGEEEVGGGVFLDWQEAHDYAEEWLERGASQVKGRAEAAAPEGGPGEHGAQRSLDALREKQAPATPGGEGLNLPPGMPPGEGV